VRVPQLEASVFLLPGEHVKNREDRLVVLNLAAKSMVDKGRSQHEEYVFTFRGKPISQMNNTA
jgi:hypothetical protein